MPAPLLIVFSTLLFATMGVCVKLASAFYPPGEIVFYRGLVGAVLLGTLAYARGGTLKTKVPAMHFWRSLTGVVSLSLWFYSFAGLPVATAVTLNYTSSVWMALFLIGGAVMMGSNRIDGRLILTVLVGFVGVFLILRPTIEQEQLWHGLCGLTSGLLAATAYLQVASLGRAGEPDYRIVFYFSLGSVVTGASTMLWTGFTNGHTWRGLALLISVGALATVAQMLLTRAYAKGKPLVNASLQYLGIVFSFVYGVVIFNDPVTWFAVAGMVLIIGAGLGATLLRSRAAPKVDPATTANET